MQEGMHSKKLVSHNYLGNADHHAFASVLGSYGCSANMDRIFPRRSQHCALSCTGKTDSREHIFFRTPLLLS